MNKIKLFFLAGWIVPKLVMVFVLQQQSTLLYLYLLIAVAVVIIPMIGRKHQHDG